MSDRFHVTVSVADAPNRRVIEHIARALGLTGYDARYRLKSPLPRSMAFRPDYASALALARDVVGAGLPTILYHEASLPKESPFPAFRMGRAGDGFIFETRQGERRKLAGSDIAFVVFGIKRSTNIETNYEYTDVVHTAEGARTSIGIQSVRRHRSEPGAYMTFFDRSADTPPIHINAGAFDFTCLGKKNMGYSDHANARKLMEMVGSALGDTPIDRRLMETFVGETTIPHNRKLAPDAEYAMSILLYWEWLAAGSESRFYNGVTGYCT